MTERTDAPLRISVVGLGKLGASMAAAMADGGHQVIGYDVDTRAVRAVQSGKAPVAEPQLQEMIDRNRGRLSATSDLAEAIGGSDVTFVVVPTPSEPSGSFGLMPARRAFAEIGAALAAKPSYHVVVLASTVLPGATRHGLIPALERAAGRAVGPDIGVCYSPQFIALGSVIHDFLHPDLTLVGELDERSGSTLERVYRAVQQHDAPIRRMSLENAELTKIALNTYVTTKITFANMLADLCERIPGGDVDVVSGALGLDRRIGARYLTGALSYGGPCFPRDNLALSFLARELGTSAGLAETTHAMNDDYIERAVAQLDEVARSGGRIAILGLAYKPHTHVTDESPGLKLARGLAARGGRMVGFDPLVREVPGLALAASVDEALAGADAVVVTTPDPAFRDLRIPRSLGSVVVLDCWRASPGLRDDPGVDYRASGVSTSDAVNDERLRTLWESVDPALRTVGSSAD